MLSSPSILSLRLADHVRACRIGEQMLFLDLRRSKFFAVGGPRVAALSTLIGEGSVDADTQDMQADSPAQAWIRPLCRQELLTSDPAPATPGRPQAFVEALSSLNVEDANHAAGVDWRHLARLWRATLVASSWLRRLSLDEIADRVATLRRRHSGGCAPALANGLLDAVATYERLRPFALTSHDRCLYDSLTLIHFLAAQGLFPKWVIGVRVHPFGAHSWVQSGSVVLNDLAERVRHYQPVLVV